jgi:hypothetical protein
MPADSQTINPGYAPLCDIARRIDRQRELKGAALINKELVRRGRATAAHQTAKPKPH